MLDSRIYWLRKIHFLIHKLKSCFKLILSSVLSIKKKLHFSLCQGFWELFSELDSFVLVEVHRIDYIISSQDWEHFINYLWLPAIGFDSVNHRKAEYFVYCSFQLNMLIIFRRMRDYFLCYFILASQTLIRRSIYYTSTQFT